jgi:parallel beta-helix repeat protein
MGAFMFSRAYCIYALFMCFLLILNISSYAQTNAYSKPTGFLRLNIPENTQTLVSTPFEPFDGTLNNFFLGQLTGESTDSTGDRVIKWLSQTQSYTSAFKADNTGDSAKNGKWFEEGINWTPTTLTLSPGEGFWIQNQHSATQRVFLMGKVVLDDNKSITFSPAYNVFSYPFTSKIGLNYTDLKNDGAHGAIDQNGSPDVFSKVSPSTNFWLLSDETSQNNGKWFDENNVLASESLKLGKGYWYNRQVTTSFTWTEDRPYLNPFDVSVDAPEITGMSVYDANLNAITLSISCTGASGETLEIFYKDLDEDDSLITESGWSIAKVDFATNSNTSVTWTDFGESSPAAPVVARDAVTVPYMRVYMVSRQDIDSDCDGISDGREFFVYGTNYASADSDLDGLNDYAEINTYGTNPLNADTDGDGFSDYLEISIYGTNANNASSIPVDTTPPTQPSSLSVKTCKTLISITWTASTDNVGVATYIIYRDGQEVGRTEATRFVDINLAADCQYKYTVKACDHMGNESPASNALTAQTVYGATLCYVDAQNGDDLNDGTTAGTAKKTIQAAIDISASGTYIIVAEGIYYESIEVDGKDLVIVSSSGAENTIIDNTFMGTRGILIKNTSNLKTIIDGFTIEGGESSANGGGIFIDSASPVISNCVLENNSAVNGGGLAISGSTAFPAITNCTIQTNSASNNGGGIYFNSQSKPVIKGCSVSWNTSSGLGGGIYGE